MLGIAKWPRLKPLDHITLRIADIMRLPYVGYVKLVRIISSRAKILPTFVA